MTLTERIKDVAAPLGHSFASIEREANFGRGTIRKWDTNVPSADKLLKVATILNTSMDYLMSGKFATCQVLSSEDEEIIELFHRLPLEKREYFKGKIEGYLEGIASSVAAEPLQNSGAPKKSYPSNGTEGIA